MKTVPKKVKELLTSGWTSDNGDEDLKLYRKRRSSACRMGAYCGESLSQSAEQLSRKYMLDTKESPGKALAQSFVWWPHLDADLVKKARDCEVCKLHQKAPGMAPLHPREWPVSPWSRIHTDYARPFLGKMFLVLVDAHSKWIEVCYISSHN